MPDNVARTVHQLDKGMRPCHRTATRHVSLSVYGVPAVSQAARECTNLVDSLTPLTDVSSYQILLDTFTKFRHALLEHFSQEVCETGLCESVPECVRLLSCRYCACGLALTYVLLVCPLAWAVCT